MLALNTSCADFVYRGTSQKKKKIPHLPHTELKLILRDLLATMKK
jgi:hypothetical protein